jgi:2-phosphosulfolactate phosphatase
MAYFDQNDSDIRCEWGLAGIVHLAPLSDVVVIVDVLSFSTCVDIAVGRGAMVYPLNWRGGSAEEFARSFGATLAGSRRSHAQYSLSPTSLLRIESGTRLVLPSPNGATLSSAAASAVDTLNDPKRPSRSHKAKPPQNASFEARQAAQYILSGCLRNAKAVAHAAQRLGTRILVVPAGERWHAPAGDESLRPAIEDLIGAGAIISQLQGDKSPEARVAEAAYDAASGNLHSTLKGCSSGKELVERGFEKDVEVASELDCSSCVPMLANGAYIRLENL